ISDRKQAELEIIRNRDLREAIFNESADAIFLVDQETNLTVDCNRRTLELFEAQDKQQLIDIEAQTLQKHEFTPEEIQIAAEEILNKGFWSKEVEYNTCKGNMFWGNLAVKQINVAQKVMNLIRVSDISEQQAALREREIREKQIQRSLEEKETLLKEIHHRVKNNLQIISSLLRMQSRRILDEKTLILFQEAQNRVQSMALIHEQLYYSDDISQIDFGEYISSLMNNLFRCYGVNEKKIVINIETNNLQLNLDNAIPCGLIINELVSNSFKYAFPNGMPGKISIIIQECQNSKNDLLLIISDTGIGISNTLKWEESNSLGLKIVRSLTRQLKGNISLNCGQGANFQIIFPKSIH
ncbi:MAG: histidine kinase dimerization/phosphoacceptor domain -containing protein, partial [Cyanobacteria bacterium P01_A01_bin.84]